MLVRFNFSFFNRMNLKRFLSKNAFIILVIVILGLFFVFFRKTEGFQADTMPVSYSYDTSNCYGDFEPVTTNSGQKLCLKKCNKIKANYVTATSDPTVCKEMSGTRVVKTVSRNYSQYSCNFPNTVFGSTLQGGIPRCVVTTRAERGNIRDGGYCINREKYSIINTNDGMCSYCYRTGLNERQYGVRLLNNTYRCVPTGY